MTQLGADVEELDRIASRVGGTAGSTDAVGSSLGRMADELAFHGRHGTELRDYRRGPGEHGRPRGVGPSLHHGNSAHVHVSVSQTPGGSR